MNINAEKQINDFVFDGSGNNIVMLLNFNAIQKRCMNNVKKIIFSLQLDVSLKRCDAKMMALSDSGRFCCIAGGVGSVNSVLVDMESNTKTQLKSKNLIQNTYCPSFINGNDKCVAIGDMYGGIEIWDVMTKQSVKFIKEFHGYVTCLFSMNNILVALGQDKKIKVFNTNDWNIVITEDVDAEADYLTLSNDGRYIATAGEGGFGVYELVY
eukprot:279887_1